jgi:xanthine dehydrogenase YagS FAD-binding subunit
MKLFTYQQPGSIEDALAAKGTYLAGGTSLVDLLKLEVLDADRVVDLGKLELRRIEADGRGLKLGALATNAEVANHPDVKRRWPGISLALLSGASPQLRNVATVGGNLLQRTRCAYYRDLATRCNKRAPGQGCDAMEGWTRMHALLGTSDKCIAAHPSDFCVALSALDAVVHVRGSNGEREMPFGELHLLPGETPEREFALNDGEIITSVYVPASAAAQKSRYVKARDRHSYAFALASCAAGLEIAGGGVRAARIALGGVGTRPWRVPAAERALVGAAPSKEAFRKAAEIALEGARPRGDNAFKVELAKRCVVRALITSAEAA